MTSPNTFATIVSTWVVRSFPVTPRFVVRFTEGGELEAVVHAPRGSRAVALVVCTSKGNAWIRLGPPHMFYGVESRGEMARLVRGIVADRVLFVATYRGRTWTGTTLIRRGAKPILAADETALVLSWSGRYDAWDMMRR